MRRHKNRLLSTTCLGLAIGGGLVLLESAPLIGPDGIAVAGVAYAACQPCNPCAAVSPCNPCAALLPAAGPCNPCAVAHPCSPDATVNPCNPCAVRPPPANPCAAR